MTFVTVGELARWAEKRHWGTRARTELVTWLGRRVILPYDERVAWKWGQLSIVAEQRGRARPINDAWIEPARAGGHLPLRDRRVLIEQFRHGRIGLGHSVIGFFLE